MQDWVILYWPVKRDIVPQAFICQAANSVKAETLCKTAYPGCTIAWAAATKHVDEAYANYWNGDSGDEIYTFV